MAFLCPVRIGRKKKKHGHLESDLLSGTLSRQLPQMGRITGSASIETLVRVGIEKEHGLSPDSKMIVLHDFTPCVDDELEVARGQIVNVLYQENDWVYVISESQQHEGFIPFSYCTPYEAPLENILQFKKKMPRSGPGSVVSGSGFNEMAVDPGPNDPDNALKMVANGGSSVDTFRAVNYVNNKSSTCPTASGATSVVSEGAKCYLVDGITSADKDALTLPIKNSPNSEFGTQYRAANQYSPGLSMPMSDSISQKQNQQHHQTYNSMLNIDMVSTTQNLTNPHTATGPSTTAPSIVSACSNGGRSNLSSNPNSNTINNNKPNLLLKPSNGVGVGLLNPMNDAANHGYGGGSAYPNDSLVRKMDYFSQVQPTLDSIVNPTNSQIGEMYPFFKDQVGRFIVLFSFLARDENELSVERGEVVNVLNKEDQDWYWVARSDSQEGFVPALYICPAEMLLNAHNASLVLNQMRQSNLNSQSNNYSQVAHHQQQQPNPYGEPNNMLSNTHIITTMPNNHNAPNGYQFNSNSGPGGMLNQQNGAIQNGGIQNGLPLNGINFTQPSMPLRLHHVPPPITG